MTDKVKIKTMTLETSNGQKIELSIEEMRDLYHQLDPLFKEKPNVIQELLIRKEYVPPYRWYSPTWTTLRSEPQKPNPFDVYCMKSESGLKASFKCEV